LIVFGANAAGFVLKAYAALGFIMGGRRTPGKWRCVIKSERNGPWRGPMADQGRPKHVAAMHGGNRFDTRAALYGHDHSAYVTMDKR
jgi:hypothetical protein